MHRPKFKSHAVLSAIALAAVLTTGCSTDTPATTDAAASTASESPGPAAAQEQLAVVSAPSGAATPTAVADGDGGGGAKKSSLKVASYDRKTGRAVITSRTPTKPTARPSTPPPTTAPADPSAGASGSSSAGASASAGAPSGPSAQLPVAVGDIIASAPAPGAPDGVLAKVTDVVGAAGNGGTAVETEPAKLNSVLGASKAEGEVPVDPSSVDVKPLVNGVKVSWAKTGDLHFGPEGAKLPLGSLRLDVGAAIATAEGAPASAAASVEGFVQLAPEVAFSYDGSADADGSDTSDASGTTGDAAGSATADSTADSAGKGTSPDGAFLGLSGDWASKWSLKGRAAGSTDGQPIRIPFAELHSDPVIQVGPIPVVVNLDLTCYIQVNADGKVTVDVEQDLKGDFRVGGSFSWAKGWTPVSESDMTGEPLKTKVTAAGDVKAALGAEATVGLYGTVGVTADLAPYVRAHADASAEGSADGTGSASGAYALYGGVDLTGTLNFQLTIFGTPVFQTKIPLGALHHEWLLTEGRATTSPPPTKSG
ncbi:hypothetical protein [Streptomyces sp. Tu102]|uniref:hypothetical protein n=1 Tax=Streptomyces sp. Tu102 TaxID=2838019 RepID=UPI001BDDC2B7|nr:hypothetical protein [Streptomyces sp. Tu102]MBT1097442.1 hypothetical protein [Streptomyces sp. Tu102]